MNLTNSSSVTEDTVHLNLAEVAYQVYIPQWQVG
jgi:hypothetical protein